jgi:hypothetical protein
MVIFVAARSLEELKNLIRKIEFNKTEPELLIDLIYKAMKAGEGERERLKRVSEKSHNLFRLLKDKGFFCPIKSDEKTLNELKGVPIGAIDGSFQVVGGVGGRWYVILGISQVIAENGFTLQPTIKVDGGIESLEAVDEGFVNQKSEILMMLGEIKALRGIAEVLGNKNGSYVLIDGPIIDPPLYNNEEYVENRVSVLQSCYERKVNIIGFVKRIMGSNYLSYLKKEVGSEQVTEFTNDLDLLSTIMFDAVKSESCPVYTYPINYEDGYDNKDRATLTYNLYKDRGLTIYYSYYKPSLRGKIFRVEFASFRDISEQKVMETFNQVLNLINQIWTPPGMVEPLPIMIAHNKCNVRRGAAETIYYEIMARALSEGGLHLWLES